MNPELESRIGSSHSRSVRGNYDEVGEEEEEEERNDKNKDDDSVDGGDGGGR